MSENTLRIIFCTIIFFAGYGFISFFVDLIKLISKCDFSLYKLYSVSVEFAPVSDKIITITKKNRKGNTKTYKYRGSLTIWHNYPTGELCGYEVTNKLMKYDKMLEYNSWNTLYFNEKKFKSEVK